MNRIDKRENGRLTTWTYLDETLCDARSAAERIVRAAELEGFRAGYIALRDLERRADEGGDSRELPPDSDAAEIADALAGQTIDRLYLSGRYRGVRAGIGIDLRSFELSVTLPEGREDLADEIARALA